MKILYQLIILSFIVSIGFIPLSFAQGVQTAGGVDVDGSWYVGEGLKKGDYFEYSLCEIDLNDCAPIKLKMWIKGKIQHVTETLWDAKIVINDGNKIIKGSMGLGETTLQPITFDDNLHDYAIAFKSSLVWLSACATGYEGDRILGPKEFRDAAWCKIAAIGGAQLIPKRAEQTVVPDGIVDTIVVGWYSGNSNEIWIVYDFPLPVKALTFAWVTTGIAPIMHQYSLLNYTENVMQDPFKNVTPTINIQKLLDCETDFHDYTSNRVSTNTHSMIIQYNYSPEFPKEGCSIDWKINFMNKFNDVEFIDQIHYDIWVVDENGTQLRSYASDIGRTDLFNGFGQVHVNLPVNEDAGIVKYAIFVHGVGSKSGVSDTSLAGYSIIEIEIIDNPLFENDNSEIPSWIKNNAGWWADGVVSDVEFISGIEYLILENILEVPTTSPTNTGEFDTKIPSWIRNNAGWWAEGMIDDDSFVQGIEFLIKEGILKV